jgi:hypothetical protein
VRDRAALTHGDQVAWYPSEFAAIWNKSRPGNGQFPVDDPTNYHGSTYKAQLIWQQSCALRAIGLRYLGRSSANRDEEKNERPAR